MSFENVSKYNNFNTSLQLSITLSLVSVIYLEYLLLMNKVEVPIKRINVPELSSIKRILVDPISAWVVNELPNRLRTSIYIAPLLHLDEFKPLMDDNVHLILNDIIKESYKIIPSIFIKRFQLDGSQQLIREEIGLEVFGKTPITESHYKYISEQCALQLLLSTKRINRDIINVKECLTFSHNDIISINNDNALTPIFLNNTIISDSFLMDKINFVTSSNIVKSGNEYKLNTNPNNIVRLIKINGTT